MISSDFTSERANKKIMGLWKVGQDVDEMSVNVAGYNQM